MLIKCKTCEGKGYAIIKGLGFAVECDVCHGKGGFDVPENKELCPECNGRGTVYLKTKFGDSEIGNETNCTNCFGTGLIDKKEPCNI